jgi:hypothetical protein
MILFGIIFDIFRSRDLSGIVKAIWIIAIIIFPLITVIVYLIMRGSSMHERSVKDSQMAQQQFDSYVQSVASSGGAASEIEKAKALLDAGAISQDEFDSIKAKALAS